MMSAIETAAEDKAAADGGSTPPSPDDEQQLEHVITSQEGSEEPPERRYLVRKPQALQYFHRGVLKKAQEKERVAGRFELFFDLLYVALIANFADALTEEPSGTRLVIFILTFTPAWNVWADAKENANNYYNDDILQRVATLWVMALLTLYGNNANSVGEDLASLRITVATYMVIRFTQAAFFWYYSIASHYHRVQNRCYVGMEIIDLCLWIPLFFESVSDRAKIAVAVIALLFEWSFDATYFLTFGPWIARWLDLEYSTALDINHENDRYTAFTIIVLGEFTYYILVGSPAAGGLHLNYLRGVWTLVIAFCFNSMYIYQDGAVNSVHPARRSVWIAFLWLLIHLPMSAGLLIGGHVSATMTEEKPLEEGQRWLWGGGLAVGFAALWILSILFRDADQKGRLLMPKYIRTLPRLMASIILALLPLASSEELDDTGLVSIGAAISAFVVAWETAGSLEKGFCMFESWA